MEVLFAIPVKVVPSKSTLRCCVPKAIANEVGIKEGDTLLWVLYEDNQIAVKKIKRKGEERKP
jgi:AbrB family looped-hinge helix DNA binding protein